MKKKTLITGVSGFIGDALCRHLDQHKAGTILGVDRLRPARICGKFFILDLLDQRKVVGFLKKHRPADIFHLAGGRIADPYQMWCANVKTTQVLLESVLSISGYRPRIVVMGSAAEYGQCLFGHKIRESAPALPQGEYGSCKLLQTRTALYFAQQGVDVRVARIFNILGPGLPTSTAGGAFARDIVALQRVSGAGVLEVGSLKAVRDFLDIRDVCSALLAVVLKGRRAELYNVCCGRGVSIRDLLHRMICLSGVKDVVVREDLSAGGGVSFAVGSCAKLMKETGWRPRYSLKQSLVDTLEYYRVKGGTH